jgi:type IV secretory pathway component VirB8
VKPVDRDELAKQQKLEALRAELYRHRRMSYVALLLVVVLNVVILALLAYLLLLGHA